MSKRKIDYSNSVIYKIQCKNLLITDFYVGSTTNFIKRKYSHKCRCYNTNDRCYNVKLYTFIRNNGGWDNWDMLELVKLENIKDSKELFKYECEYYNKLKPSLNEKKPYQIGNEFYLKNKDNEDFKNKRKQYYKDNKEKMKELNKKWYEKNKDNEEFINKRKKYRESKKKDVLINDKHE
jgi:hypothetical protein